MRWFFLTLLALTTVACSSVGAYRTQGEGITVPPDAEAAIQVARSDLQARTGSAETPEVRSIEAVDWPDSSLGCPEPDRLYAQVITPGYRIVMLLGEDQYVYHAAGSRAVYCPQDGGGGDSLMSDAL